MVFDFARLRKNSKKEFSPFKRKDPIQPDNITVFTITKDFIPKHKQYSGSRQIIDVRKDEHVLVKHFVGHYFAEGVNLSSGLEGCFPVACISKKTSRSSASSSEEEEEGDLLTFIGSENPEENPWAMTWAEEVLLPEAEEQKKKRFGRIRK